MTTRYCQKCGAALQEARLCAPLWLCFLRCGGCGQSYLEVADPRWMYPLLFLEPGVLEEALAAGDEELAKAAREIVRIDYKTVSIVAFERALRGLGG